MQSLHPHGSGVLQKRKTQKQNSDNGLHKHFAVLPPKCSVVWFLVTLTLNENTMLKRKTMLFFSQHAKINVNIMKTKHC